MQNFARIIRWVALLQVVLAVTSSALLEGFGEGKIYNAIIGDGGLPCLAGLLLVMLLVAAYVAIQEEWIGSAAPGLKDKPAVGLLLCALSLAGVLMAASTFETKGYMLGDILIARERVYPGMFYLLAIMNLLLVVDGLTMPNRLKARADRKLLDNFRFNELTASEVRY